MYRNTGSSAMASRFQSGACTVENLRHPHHHPIRVMRDGLCRELSGLFPLEAFEPVDGGRIVVVLATVADKPLWKKPGGCIHVCDGGGTQSCDAKRAGQSFSCEEGRLAADESRPTGSGGARSGGGSRPPRHRRSRRDERQDTT